GLSHPNAMGVLTAPNCRGDLRRWGSHTPAVKYENEPSLVTALTQKCQAEGIPLRSIEERRYNLDHGVMVPMYFLGRGLGEVALVPLTFSWLPLSLHHSFGQVLGRVAQDSSKRVAIIASGDLSHRLIPDAPAGYHPQSHLFDERLTHAVARWDTAAILNLDPDLIDQAGECGLRSIVILIGALSEFKVKPQVLSYEGPFGVGYLVASLNIESGNPGGQGLHPLAQLAKEAVEHYVLHRKLLPLPNLSEEMKGRAGVFVSIKMRGELRGCIGTFEPCHSSIAEEIIHNAISSACRDPRFPPVTKEELAHLSYSVDILTPPQPVSDIKDLDPKRYGVIVERGGRKGLLLPGLEAVNTVEEQILICCHKAGIS
ncbi:MAG: AmmeMemoRadiSam system protein A, partial [Chloroflexota bacterium]